MQVDQVRFDYAIVRIFFLENRRHIIIHDIQVNYIILNNKINEMHSYSKNIVLNDCQYIIIRV